MTRCKYKKLDAFASESSAGNPAACLYLDSPGELEPGEMQRIARQHKGFVSEVVFCSPSNSADYELAYYSSECEVEFCGHGTIACMYSLLTENGSKPQYTIHTGKGLLPVYNEIETGDAVYIAAPAPVFSNTADIPESIAEALGIRDSLLVPDLPVGLVNAGLDTCIVPLRTLKDLLDVYPVQEALKEYCLQKGIDIVLAFSMETEDPRHIAHTRVFAPKYGYLEDPATGSGNSAFGCYMQKEGLWKGEGISVEQGAETGAFNTVKLKGAADGTVLFGGSAAVRIEGFYNI